MKATVLLADWAQAVNGKLYIQGGGWTRTSLDNGLLNCALAIRILVGWDETNIQHQVTIRLVDQDGNMVNPPIPNGRPIEVQSAFEVGRPPGSAAGQEIDAALAMGFLGIPMAKGRYRFTLEIDGEEFDTGATFDVI
jgi:hypothetical protein